MWPFGRLLEQHAACYVIDMKTERSSVRVMAPDRPGFGTSRHWRRTIGEWVYSFTLVDMPDGEVRWFVRRYDRPVSQHGTDGFPEKNRMQFDCYWNLHRQWTFNRVFRVAS